MKAALLTLLILIFHNSYAQIWQQTSDFSGSPRDDGTGFIIGNYFYFGTGLDHSFTTKRDFHKFDLSTETWTEVSSLPESKERQYAIGVAYNGKGYVFGGIDGAGNYLNDLWQYDPLTDIWIELTSLPSFGRSGMVEFTLNNTLYVVGGKSQLNNALNEVWCYIFDSNIWVQKNDLTFTETWRGLGVELNNFGYIGFGLNEAGSLNDSFYKYNPTTDSWTGIPLLIEGRTYPSYSVIDNQLYVYGGELTNGNYSNEFMRIDLEASSFVTLSAFPSDARRGSIAFSNNTDFFITTGVTASNRTNETWKSNYVVDLKEQSQSDLNITISNAQIKGIKEITEPVCISMFSFDGREVVNVKNVQDNYTFDLPSNGFYFLKIWNKDVQFFERVYID